MCSFTFAQTQTQFTHPHLPVIPSLNDSFYLISERDGWSTKFLLLNERYKSICYTSLELLQKDLLCVRVWLHLSPTCGGGLTQMRSTARNRESSELKADCWPWLVITFELLDHIIKPDGLSITSACSGGCMEVWGIMTAHYFVSTCLYFSILYIYIYL